MNVNRTLLMLIVVCLVAVFLGCTEGQAEKKSDTGADQAPPQLASSAADTLSDSAEARSDGKGPKIVFAETTYDFGKKMSGVDLTNTFTFKNEGDSTLIIENVKGGWGCTAALASAREIPPGGEGKIDVTFKTARRKGINKQQVTVTSNDPNSPRIQLEVIADLEQLLAASPNRQWFGQVKQDDVVTRPFVFEGKLVNEFQIKNIRMKDEEAIKGAFQWKTNDTVLEGQRQLTLEVTLDAKKMRPGRFNNVLVVSTNLPDMPELELNLNGEVLGPISATPQRLYFGQFEVDKEMEKTITLASNNGKPFKIMNASIDEKEFRIDPWNREAATEHSMTIRFLTSTPRDRIRTALLVNTDMDAQSEVQIEIHAYQQRSRPAVKPGSDASSLRSTTHSAQEPARKPTKEDTRNTRTTQ